MSRGRLRRFSANPQPSIPVLARTGPGMAGGGVLVVTQDDDSIDVPGLAVVHV